MRRNNLLLSLAGLLAGCLLSSGSVAADSSPVIELHAQVRLANLTADEESEPGSASSESTQLIMALLEEAGLEYEFSLSPWTRIHQLLETRPNVLSYPVARIPEREDKVFWVGMMRPIDLSLYGLREKKDRLPTTLDAARDFQIGVLRNDAIDNYLSNQGFENLIRFSNLEHTLDMLQRGRFDLFAFEAVGIERTLKLEGLGPDYVVSMVPLEAISTESFFALSLATGDNIKRRLRAAYDELVENGAYERIMGFEHDSRFAH